LSAVEHMEPSKPWFETMKWDEQTLTYSWFKRVYCTYELWTNWITNQQEV
jgi:hypothetical protein